MVRGICLCNDFTLSKLVKSSSVWAAMLLLVNVLSVYLSTESFIAPLERLAKRLKSKKTKTGKVLWFDGLWTS
jgi:hypothetical protein